jgi:hypothetical protein
MQLSKLTNLILRNLSSPRNRYLPPRNRRQTGSRNHQYHLHLHLSRTVPLRRRSLPNPQRLNSPFYLKSLFSLLPKLQLPPPPSLQYDQLRLLQRNFRQLPSKRRNLRRTNLKQPLGLPTPNPLRHSKFRSRLKREKLHPYLLPPRLPLLQPQTRRRLRSFQDGLDLSFSARRLSSRITLTFTI